MNLSTVYALAAAALFGASTPLAKSLGLGICLQPGFDTVGRVSADTPTPVSC